jgi:hypothetical protein
MSDSFNGYHVWLGIPPSEQPPNHYRLLGIATFETDLDVIDHAADRQMAHVRTYQSGRNAALSQQLLNELASARVCLLNPRRKSEYDEQLRSKLAVGVAVVPVGKAVPVAQPVEVAAIPRAAPISKPADDGEIEVETRAAAPLASRVIDDDDDDLLLGGSPFASRAIETRAPRKHLVDPDASLQRALVYIFMGVAILVVIMVLYGLVRNLASTTDWRNWFTTPVYTAPVEPGADDDSPPPPEAPPPTAPAPALSGSNPDPSS